MAKDEIGRTGQQRYGGVFYEEFLPELRGQRGIRAYKEMSENDDIIGAILFAVKMLIRNVHWGVQPGGTEEIVHMRSSTNAAWGATVMCGWAVNIAMD